MTRSARCLALVVASLGACRRSAPIAASNASASAPATAALVDAAAPNGARHVGLESPDGRRWTGAERVDADVVRVTTLTALFVEANEIRCPRVVRTESAPVPKDIGPWQVEGDLVETDALTAHSVSARVIVADEIRAMVVKTLSKPHRWAGAAAGSAPVRNRVTLAKGLMAPTTDAPSF